MDILGELDDNWPAKALCKNDPKFTSYHIDDVSKAKKICEQCSVQVECILATAMNGGVHVSAGMSHYDRLMLQWERARNDGDEIFGDSSIYVSEVLRRQR